MIRYAFLFSFTLAGCATFNQLEQGLNNMMGEHESIAFNVLGYPDSAQQFGSDTVYYWAVNKSGTVFVPQTSTTYGSVGDVSFYGKTTYNQAVPVNYSCLIKLVSDSSGYLKSWEYDGNYGGCSNYINRVDAYYNR
ncbi:hypothetical protein NB550_12200 [Vibrio parahaemolyticus]|uniref:hypothetical protein n=1 Tax=Vibrio parahaemolyticus TaxID=670 RepID=UPI00215BF411|nr:hypothetical protein [Vibrio parahaemolyticus]MCR9888042.1 hypothetical protein [Vibrio parahaemolyticus]MCR9918256.1 hypothetical protein [Vibrio parahaemolyticus]